MIVKQSTAASITIGPILDADGVAKTDEVVASILASKNGGAPAALDGSATLTHRHTGNYTLTLTVTDTDTVGTLEFTLSSTTNAMPIKALNVVEEAVYVAFFAESGTGVPAQLGYPEGFVYLDPTNGASGTTVGVNGTISNPSDTFANAAAIATSRGIKRIRALTSGTVSSGTFAGYVFDLNGTGWTLNQNATISGKIYSSGLTGDVIADIGAGQNTNDLEVSTWYENLRFSLSMRAMSYCYLRKCVIGTAAPVTFTIAGDNGVDLVYLEDCYTAVVSGLTFDCSGGADLKLSGWYGDFTIANLAAGTTVEVYGWGAVTLAASCTGGTVRHTSHIEITDNSGGAVTTDLVSQPGTVTEVTGGINTASGTIQTLDALDTAQDLQHSTTQSDIAALNNLSSADVAAELATYDSPTNAEMLAAFAALNDLSAAQVNAEVDTALGDYDGPTNTEMLAAFSALNDLSSADVTAAVPTTAENAAGLLDLTNGIETDITPRQALRAIAAKAMGLLSGAGTGTEVVKGVGQTAGGTTRGTATVDGSGNISAWSLNL